MILLTHTLFPSEPAWSQQAAAVLPMAAAGQAPRAGDWWMGVYLGETKLGYTHVSTEPAPDGKKTRVKTETWMRAAVLGFSIEQSVDTDEVLDAALRPVSLRACIGSAGRVTEVKARFLKTQVNVERKAGDDVTTKILPIPKGANLVADADTALLNRAFHPGDVCRYTYLNIVTLALEDATTEVLRKEKVTVGGRSYDTVVTKTSSATMDATAWMLPDGRPVKVITSPGLVMVAETREVALAGNEERGYEVARDLAVQTAVQTKGALENAGETRVLKVKIAGIPEKRFVLSDYRQRARVLASGEGVTAQYTVDADAPSPAVALTAAERARWLAATSYLQAQHPEIVARAREAVAGAQDDAARVKALWAWVHSNMRSQGDIGMPRSALEVLREPVGVCRDYATLYGALARAVGIPTRVCAGIVHFRDRFYYHAWAESYIGHWVPVDPTRPAGFVDATHVKFTEGDAVDMYGAVKTIGRLSAEILEAK